MSASDAAAIEPDTKDWTFVITQGCDQCGFRPQPAGQTGELLRASVPTWRAVLERADARERPRATTWSPLEYGCHVRDVCEVFDERLRLMLGQDDPGFPNWDQDQAAVDDRYHEQEPIMVAGEYEHAAGVLAAAFDAVQPEQWQRTGRRSNGSAFTVETLAVYFLHDIVHHLHDVGAPAPAVV